MRTHRRERGNACAIFPPRILRRLNRAIRSRLDSLMIDVRDNRYAVSGASVFCRWVRIGSPSESLRHSAAPKPISFGNLADVMTTIGIREIRLSPWRTLYAGVPSRQAGQQLLDIAGRLVLSWTRRSIAADRSLPRRACLPIDLARYPRRCASHRGIACRSFASPGRFMFPAAPRDAPNPGPPISCWSDPRAITASCVKAPRKISPLAVLRLAELASDAGAIFSSDGGMLHD